jgi:hypothetical protein
MVIYRINKTDGNDVETEWEIVTSASGECSISRRTSTTWEVVGEYPSLAHAFAHMVSGKPLKKKKGVKA